MHFRRSGTGQALTLFAAALVSASLATACGNDSESPTDEPAATAPAGVSLPDTPAGQQTSWFLEASAHAPIPEEELAARMSPAFQQELPPSVVNDVLSVVGALEPVEIQSATDDAVVLDVRSQDGPLTLTVRVDAEGLISALNLAPALDLPPLPESWDELSQRVGELGANTSFLAAELSDDGSCEPVHEVRGDDVMPIASMYKLYVMEAVQRAVDAGELAWDAQVTVTEENQSWPTGLLQDEEPGTQVTVAEAAGLMISFSDNTAADILVDTVGRESVEDVIAETSDHAEENRPLLTTQEMFKLRIVDYPAMADEYAGLSEDERRSFLTSTVAAAELPELAAAEQWTAARHIDTIGWFGSAADMCAAFGALYDGAAENVATAMSDNDGGISLGAQWPTVWYKGGSEPGVTALGYLAENDDNERYVVVVLSNSPDQEVPELAESEARIMEMMSVAKGAFGILTQ